MKTNNLTNINNVLKTNLSEFAIDSIFNLSNSIPISDFNSYWGQIFWFYSKGQVNLNSVPNNKNKIKEYNSINDIKNNKLRKFVYEKLDKETRKNNCKGLVFFSNSDLARKFTDSKDLQNYIKDYRNGKADNSIHFKINNGFDYFSTLGYAEIYNVEKLSNGDYEIVLVDTYDFNNNKNIINRMGYKLQREEISKPFFSIIYVRIPLTIIKGQNP